MRLYSSRDWGPGRFQTRVASDKSEGGMPRPRGNYSKDHYWRVCVIVDGPLWGGSCSKWNYQCDWVSSYLPSTFSSLAHVSPKFRYTAITRDAYNKSSWSTSVVTPRAPDQIDTILLPCPVKFRSLCHVCKYSQFVARTWDSETIEPAPRSLI